LLLDSGVRVRVSTGAEQFEVGERCYAVVRPEKLRIDRIEEPGRDDMVQVEGLVESSVYLGTATQFVVRLPDGVAMTVLVPNTGEADRQLLPGAGARVRLAWASEHMHVVREAKGGASQADEKLEKEKTVDKRPAEPAMRKGAE
jgi:ABC-type Fe3+/spermidine/putrescine transport system ATPase subunit